MDETKKEPFVNINPNGWVPAIEDPNTGITLWELGAILEYLVKTYDSRTPSVFPPALQSTSMLSSGFISKCPARGHTLAKQCGLPITTHKRWTVRRSATTTRSAVTFVPWLQIILAITGDASDLEKDFANLDAWLKRPHALPAISKAFKIQETANAAQGK
ncbi:hypothetical protein CNMCM5623_006875 [Aspergillus felis]|uniref:GST N-terminal domain-containing protein n=1 Tax=Aspergillus felis TaxID=1287682 RepID=A0A8H6PUT9_9EURO|nr:hypothetical protein CNMCM5623_006875 [Aspergillus felis]